MDKETEVQKEYISGHNYLQIKLEHYKNDYM